MTVERRRLLADGLVAGVAAYLAVVLFFMVLDVAAGRPLLFTAASLGQALFGGGGPQAATAVDPALVLAFNGVHLLAVLLFGFFSAWLVYETELHPDYWYVAFFLFLAATVFGYALVLVATVLVGGTLSPWLAAAATLLGAAAVVGTLAGTHASLVRTIREAPAAPGAMD